MSTRDFDLKEFLAMGELSDVRFLATHAEVHDDPNEELDEDTFTQDLLVRIGHLTGALEVRVELKVDAQFASYRVVAATQFHYQPLELEVPEELSRAFAEKVGVMAVYPYLREAINSLSTRHRQPPVTIPLLRLGEVGLGEPVPEPPQQSEASVTEDR